MSEEVLLDSPVWSLAMRRQLQTQTAVLEEYRRLVDEGRALIIGPVRQEVLSGVRDVNQFQRLDGLLAPFPNLPLVDDDYREAARCFNLCRARGIQGSHVDFLLCAVARRLDVGIFTTDADFPRYQGVLAVRLHAVQGERA